MILARVGLFVVVSVPGMYYGLTGRRAKFSAGFIISGEFMMELEYGRLNIVGDINKYNQLLIPIYILL